MPIKLIFEEPRIQLKWEELYNDGEELSSLPQIPLVMKL